MTDTLELVGIIALLFVGSVFVLPIVMNFTVFPFWNWLSDRANHQSALSSIANSMEELSKNKRR